MQLITRRTMLTAAAAAAGVGTAPIALAGLAGGFGVAIGAEEVDPIFAAIEEHRASVTRQEAAKAAAPAELGLTEEEWDHFIEEECELAFDLVGDKAPTTLAGVAALLSYVVEMTPMVGIWPERDGEDGDPANGSAAYFQFDLVKIAAAILSNVGGRVPA